MDKKQIGYILYIGISAQVSSFLICNFVNSVTSNPKDRKILAMILGSMTILTLIYAPTFVKTIKNKFTFWKPPLTSPELEALFEQLTYEEKEFLFKKGLSEKDAKGDFHLKYICPITMSLIKRPAAALTRNPNKDHAIEMYEASAITKWLEHHSNSNLSPLTKRPIEKLCFLSLEKEVKDYTSRLEEEIEYLNKNRQTITLSADNSYKNLTGSLLQG